MLPKIWPINFSNCLPIRGTLTVMALPSWVGVTEPAADEEHV